MNTIYKFPLKSQQAQVVYIYKGAKLLTAQVQEEKICIWAEVCTSQPMQEVEVAVVPTGGDVPVGFEYLDTCLVTAWAVLHVYTRRKP